MGVWGEEKRRRILWRGSGVQMLLAITTTDDTRGKREKRVCVYAAAAHGVDGAR